MERIAKLFADNLRFYRGRAELTQEALSERLNLSSITISNYESGRRWPEPATLSALAAALGIDPADLFQDRTKRPRPTPEEALDMLIDYVEKTRALGQASAERRAGYRVVDKLTPAELRLFLEENAGLDKD